MKRRLSHGERQAVLHRAYKLLAMDAEWDESKHPRAENGQFGQKGAFGTVYTQFRHNARAAVARLAQEQEGEAVGALYHPQIGDIDLIWGEAGDPGRQYAGGYGLAKIMAKHPEVVDKLQEIIAGCHIKTRSDNRAVLESDNYKAVVGLNWLENEKRWLLSAYTKEKKGNPGTTIHTAGKIGADGSPLLAPLDIIEKLLAAHKKKQTAPHFTWEESSKKWLLTAFETQEKGSTAGKRTDTSGFSGAGDTALRTDASDAIIEKLLTAHKKKQTAPRFTPQQTQQILSRARALLERHGRQTQTAA